jgi:uncharacterized metal-binding protein
MQSKLRSSALALAFFRRMILILNPDDFIFETEVSDVYVNCLYCSSKECSKGQKCPYIKNIEIPECTNNEDQMLNAAIDIAFEDERKLCRMSEVVYYCLEMKYHRIGIAYCTELSEATEILVSVLKRFFDVISSVLYDLGQKQG